MSKIKYLLVAILFSFGVSVTSMPASASFDVFNVDHWVELLGTADEEAFTDIWDMVEDDHQ